MRIKIKNIKIFTILIPFLFLTNCEQQAESEKLRRITLTINNIKDSTSLYLLNENSEKVIDTTIIIDGCGEFIFSVEKPESFTITNYVDRGKYLWLDNSDITVTGDYNNFKNLIVCGSESNKIFEIYQRLELKVKKKLKS